jgi:hyperosmotically inducible protein
LKKKGEPDRKPDVKPAAPEKQANEPPAEPKKKTEPEAKPAPGEKQPEAPAPAPPKKKTEPDRKPDSKSAQEEKPAAEPPQAPPPKAEEPAKKPVASLNLTIKLTLMAEPSLFPLEIEVEVDKQTVTLTGAVPTEEDKIKAGQIAKAIEGVESVVNKLTVDASVQNTWIKKQDEAITQLVKERLNRSETLKAVGFEVKSEHGVVSLSGKTHYQVIALEAAEAARHVPGVRAVKTAGVQLTGKD